MEEMSMVTTRIDSPQMESEMLQIFEPVEHVAIERVKLDLVVHHQTFQQCVSCDEFDILRFQGPIPRGDCEMKKTGARLPVADRIG